MKFTVLHMDHIDRYQGQWRIHTRGASTYDFAKFSQKLHEIERIWIPGGARPSCPPRSATEGDPHR